MKGLVTVTEVNNLLYTKKATLVPMQWGKNPDRNCLEYHTPIVDIANGEQMESVILRATYPILPPELPINFSFSLFFNNQRIYAIDKVLPHKGHRNNKGKGRPLYQHRIEGSHEHTWSNDGGGYAEPLPDMETATHEQYWQYFATRTNIELTGTYRHPLDEDGGQIKLF